MRHPSPKAFKLKMKNNVILEYKMLIKQTRKLKLTLYLTMDYFNIRNKPLK